MIIQPAGNRRGTEFGLPPPTWEGALGNGGAFALENSKFQVPSSKQAKANEWKGRNGMGVQHPAKASCFPSFDICLELGIWDLEFPTAAMPASAHHWMVKQEPTAYSWEDFEKDGRVAWTGVRNFQARNNLRAMKVGDRVLYYYSVIGKEAVGIARVARAAYPDPTAKEGDWSCVDLVPVKRLARPVQLAEIKASAKLRAMALLRNSRLSVMLLTKAEYTEIVRLGTTPDSAFACDTVWQ